MPLTPTYPGVYIEEIPSGVRTITGVATSITAFIGFALKGPTNDPVRIQSFGNFERRFGGLTQDSTMSYAVQQFFLNGGSDALIVRLSNPGKQATLDLDGVKLKLKAFNPGVDGNRLQVTIDYTGVASLDLFNLTIVMLDKLGSPESTESLKAISFKEVKEKNSIQIKTNSSG